MVGLSADCLVGDWVVSMVVSSVVVSAAASVADWAADSAGKKADDLVAWMDSMLVVRRVWTRVVVLVGMKDLMLVEQ